MKWLENGCSADTVMRRFVPQLEARALNMRSRASLRMSRQRDTRRSESSRLRSSELPSATTLEARQDETVPVTLTRKLANLLDGVDLSAAQVGDLLYLPPHDAAILIAEGWAEPVRVQYRRRATDSRDQAADGRRRARKRHLRR
jgi:hypothetical protein